MERKKIVGTGLVLLALAGALGCQMRRELEVTLETEITEEEPQKALAPSYVKINQMELDAITRVFLGESEDLAAAYIPSHSQKLGEGIFYYEKDNSELHYIQGKSCEYIDLNGGGIGLCYLGAWDPDSYYLQGGAIGSWLRERYPLEDLDSCSREEAIEICQPYAQAYGYTDADVSVYAMTLEALEGVWREWIGHAPNPDFKVVGMDTIRKTAQTEGTEKAFELQETRRLAVCQGNMWSKDDEALVLIYRPYIQEEIINGSLSVLQLIYVPAIEKVVYANGGYALEELDKKKQYEELISKETAVSEALMAIGVEQDNFEIENISLEYYVPVTLTRAEDGEALIPCWKIEYKKTEELMEEKILISVNGTILVDAVNGNVIIH